MRTVARLVLALALPWALTACSEGAPPPTVSALDKLSGRWVVVNYWAIWCKPCIKEIPELNQLAQQYPELAVVGVNYDGLSGPELDLQLQQLDIHFPMLDTDPAAELGTTRPVVLPTTLILNPEGQVDQVLVGPQTVQSLAQATGQPVTTDSLD